MSHNLVTREKLHEKFPEWWNEFAVQCATNIQFNHDYIVNNLAKQVPTYILRYEDLVSDPEPVLFDLFKFLLDVESIEGTVIENRIKQVSMQGFQSKAVYTLKEAGKMVDKNIDMFPPDLVRQLNEILQNYNIFYRYFSDNTKLSYTTWGAIKQAAMQPGYMEKS